MNSFKFILNEELVNYTITNRNEFEIALNQTYDKRIEKYQKVKRDEKHEFTSLFKAIDRFTQYINDRNKGSSFDFYTDLLPRIHEWSKPSSISTNEQLQQGFDAQNAVLLRSGQQNSITISSSYARYILANAFFLNIGSIAEEYNELLFGNLDFYSVYVNGFQDIAIQRCICQLSYFYQMANNPDQTERQIKFQRHILNERNSIDWMSLDDCYIKPNVVNIHNNLMEKADASVFVDFANRFIHIGCIIPSLTQEEILFSCCPELFICLLCVEEINDNEIVTVHNIKRFSGYTGYQTTFRWSGLFSEGVHDGKETQDIIIMDAVFECHYDEDAVIRDINKAYLAFKAFPQHTKISTGKWGCGAFGGDVTHKFLQQLCAASVLQNIYLDYSITDVEQAEQLRKLIEKIVSKNIPISNFIEYLIPSNTKFNFKYYNWVMKELDKDPLPS